MARSSNSTSLKTYEVEVDGEKKRFQLDEADAKRFTDAKVVTTPTVKASGSSS